MNGIFGNTGKKLGFGFMRLPMNGDQMDIARGCEMVDAFLESGFNYFDTAHGYLGGQSEIGLRECLVKRHPRESYILTNKLSTDFFKTEKEIRPLFQQQLECCGVEYFDNYLMHAQSAKAFEKYKSCRAYEIALELKAEGKIRHMGISFHDRAEVLDQILTEYPQIELVQIQFNYLDYEDASIQSRLCYEICQRHGKPVVVMEPVRGGALAKLPPEAQQVLDELQGGSAASYAIRFAAGFDGIKMVLSGMGDMDMIKDNCGYMQDFKPLNQRELAALVRVCEIIRNSGSVPCTGCSYCTDGCPKQIPIPAAFACLNTMRIFQDWGAAYYYKLSVHKRGRASDCIECGACEEACPQHLRIRELLKEVVSEFEKKE